MGTQNKPLSEMSLAELSVNLKRASEDVSRYGREIRTRERQERVAKGLAEDPHGVMIRTPFGMTDRDCYCTASNNRDHLESDSPWIDEDGVEA